jgi:hypothetical protein
MVRRPVVVLHELGDLSFVQPWECQNPRFPPIATPCKPRGTVRHHVRFRRSTSGTRRRQTCLSCSHGSANTRGPGRS